MSLTGIALNTVLPSTVTSLTLVPSIVIPLTCELSMLMGGLMS